MKLLTKSTFIILCTLLASGCNPTHPVSTTNFIPTPTRIPGSEKIAALTWQTLQSKELGISFEYPTTWNANLPQNNTITLSENSITFLISKLPNPQKLAVTSLWNKYRPETTSTLSIQKFTVAQNDITGIISNPVNQNNDLTSIYLIFPFGTDAYRVMFNYPSSKPENSLILGRIIQTFDLSNNTTGFTCPKGDYNLVANQPPEFYYWAYLNCTTK